MKLLLRRYNQHPITACREHTPSLKGRCISCYRCKLVVPHPFEDGFRLFHASEMRRIHRGDLFAAGSVDFGVGVYESRADEEHVCGTEDEVLCRYDFFE